MNRNKKKVLAAALAVCLVSILSFSTLAWFNASESVTNKFMVATSGSNLDDTAKPEDKIFSLDLWEIVDADVNNDGTVDPNGEKVSYREDGSGWNYENVLPGVEYRKEPIVENTGSYDQWIRMIVTVSDYNMFKSVVPAGSDLAKIFGGHEADDWTLDPDAIKIDTADDTISYVYYLNKKLPFAGKDSTKDDDHMVSLFTSVTLPGELTQEQMAAMGGEFEITIHADAVQTEGIKVSATGLDAANAKEAFTVIGWDAYEDYETRNP